MSSTPSKSSAPPLPCRPALPIANPDAYEWGVVHVVPYGNGYGGTTNLMLNGYGFLESTNYVPDSALDPESLALRNYVRGLTQRGLDGRGGQIVALLDFQSDLCPHPSRWNGPPVAPDAFDVYPPVWGICFCSDTAPDGDPAYVLKQFGRDIANAVKEELLP